jgi:hypothetical protein
MSSPQQNEPFCSVSEVIVLHVKTVCSTERVHYCDQVTFGNKPPHEESNDRQKNVASTVHESNHLQICQRILTFRHCSGIYMLCPEKIVNVPEDSRR